jgi:protocatechuate 4,5-dioxygenase beta chain
VAAWDSSKKVAFIASGGLSHQLEGTRAGFINKDFDLKFMESLLSNPEWATQFSIHELVEKTGTQGIELLAWLAMRAALTVGDQPGVRKVHSNYHIPISNTATGLLALEKFS